MSNKVELEPKSVFAMPDQTEDGMRKIEITMLSIVGHVLMCHQRNLEAISIFEAIHHINPEDRYTMRALIHLYIEIERYSDALELAIQHKSSDPHDSEIGYLCGLLESKALWALGRKNEARICFREYLQKASVVR